MTTNTDTELDTLLSDLPFVYRDLIHSVPQMDAEVKAKWVAALRSGEYAQGSGVLESTALNNRDKQYCCMGVLCKVGISEGVLKKVPSVTDGSDTVGTYLPRKVAKWAGVPAHVPADVGLQTVLAYLNDNVHWTFDQIADLIDKYL